MVSAQRPEPTGSATGPSPMTEREMERPVEGGTVREPWTEAGQRLLNDVREVFVHGVTDRVPSRGFALAWHVRDGIAAIERAAEAWGKVRGIEMARGADLPDAISVDNWPGGGGRVSRDADGSGFHLDAGGAWVVLYAPIQFYDGLRTKGPVEDADSATPAPDR